MTMTIVNGAPARSHLPEGTPVELFINGHWGPAAGEATLADLNPATEERLADVAAGSREDVDTAVRGARGQLEGEWGSTPGAARGQILNRIADLIERDGARMATIEALDIGKPISQPQMLDVP